MLKLPSCPYCGDKSDYVHSARSRKKKELKCRKCGKLMSVSYKLAAFRLALLFFVFLVALNTLYLFKANSYTILPNIIFTVLFIVLYMVLVPLKVTYNRIDGQEDSTVKLKKNRHRHQKDKSSKIKSNDNPIEGTVFDE